MTGLEIIEYLCEKECDRLQNCGVEAYPRHDALAHRWTIFCKPGRINAIIAPAEFARLSYVRCVETMEMEISESEIDLALAFMTTDALLEELTKNIYVMHHFSASVE